MRYKHQYFILDIDSKKVFDENNKELHLTGNAYRLLVFLCKKKNANLTEIGEYLDWVKDYDENHIRQYRYKINTIIGHNVIEYKNGVYSLVGECNTDLLQSESVKLSKMSKDVKINIYPAIIAAIMLLLSFFPFPYGYYTLLRWAVAAIAIFYAYILYSAEIKNIWLWLLIAIAILFNPIAPIYLNDKIIWNIIDVITAGFLIGLIIRFKKIKKVDNL